MIESHLKKDILLIAQTAINHCVSGEPLPNDTFPLVRASNCAGIFVTIRKNSELRGCVGLIDVEEITTEVVKETACNAVKKDPRFPPVSPDELPQIQVEVSVLSDFSRISDLSLIEIGSHGLLIVNGQKRGLLLPQVAVHNAFDRETFLSQTCIKAGLKKSAWSDPETSIYIFTSEVF